MKIYSAGIRSEIIPYKEFKQSCEKSEIDDFIEFLKDVVLNEYDIVYFEKEYALVSTTPHIIKKGDE